MIAVLDQFPQFTPAEYLDWEEQQESRYEYINGEIYAMTGGTVNHGEIAGNFINVFKNHLRGSGCRVLTSDVKVEVFQSSSYIYPDVSVTCDERDRTANKFISHPCLIVEVLSPSTKTYDQTGKFKLYRRSPSFQEYILASTTDIGLDVYQRKELGRWDFRSYEAGDSVELMSINLTFPIEQLYENINLEPS